MEDSGRYYNEERPNGAIGIDLYTEVHMNGILGFLENSTGLYLTDTVDALETIAAHDTAKTLRVIQRIMNEHGVTVERLRSDFAKVPEWITTFRELHGGELSQMVHEARKLYIYKHTAEAPFELSLFVLVISCDAPRLRRVHFHALS